MAERFGPPPEAHENKDDDDEEVYEGEVPRPRTSGLVERFFLRDDVETEDDDDEEEEGGTSESKKAPSRGRRVARSFLNMLGLRNREQGVGDTNESTKEAAEETDIESRSALFEGMLSGVEVDQPGEAEDKKSTQEISNTDPIAPGYVESRVDGDKVELPLPAEDPIIIESGEAVVPLDENTVAEVDIQQLEDEPEEHGHSSEDPEVTYASPVERQHQELVREPDDTTERVVETKESTGAAMAAFVAAEILDKHRNKKTKEKLQEQIEEVKKEAKKEVISVEQRQEQLERRIKEEGEQRTRLERQQKQQRARKEELQTSIDRPKEPQRPEPATEERPRSTRIEARKPALNMPKQFETSATERLQAEPDQRLEQKVRNVAEDIGDKRSAEALFRELEVAIEQDARRETKHEMSHERRKEGNALHQSASGGDDDQSMFQAMPSINDARQAQQMQIDRSASDIAKNAGVSGAQDYSQAATYGVAVAFVLIAIVLVIMMLS